MRIDPSLRPGLAFMTFHFPDQVDTNLLTIDATDPKSGTAEFKAAAIRVEKIEAGPQREAARGVTVPAAVGGQPEWTCTWSRCRADWRRAGRRRHRARRARDGWDGGAALPARRATRRARGHAARARRHLLLPALWALQERDRLDQPGRAQLRLPPADVPPADATASRRSTRCSRVEPRPPRVVHVCEDIACRCHGSDELIAQLEERFGGRGRAVRRRLDDLVPQPLPRPVRPRSGCARRRRRRRSRTSDARAHDRGGGARRARRAASPGRRPSRCSRRPATLRCACCDACGRVGPVEPGRLPRRTAATRRCGARSSSGPRA